MPPPRGGGRLLCNLSDKNALSSASLSGQNASGAATEQLLSGTLDFDHENDPVIYTTDFGLDIKWHMASPLPEDPSDISTTTVSSTTWAYFTAGGKDWIIIGCSNKSETFSTGTVNLANCIYYYQKAEYYNFSNTTEGIWSLLWNTDKDSLEDELTDVYANYGGFFYNEFLQTITQQSVFTNAAATDELEANEVLCLCADYITNTTFNISRSLGNDYNGSNLQSYIDKTVYGSTSTLSQGLKALPIVPQDLITSTSGTTQIISDAYVFPLAGVSTSESFYVGTYLNSTTKRSIGVNWWLRSGVKQGTSYMATYVNYSSSNVTNSQVDVSMAVRPAFVLKI